MKKIINILLVSTVFIALSSCKKYLDINQNPNNPTTATPPTPQLVLPSAIARTAAVMVTYNNYGAQTVGYYANAGGVSGWGSIISYNYTTADFSSLFTTTFDVLEDFQFVLENSQGSTALAYYNAAAKVMKAYNFQNLVDTYNDVPYSEAFKGLNKLQPKYDKAEDIYKDLAVQLDSAIYIIKTAQGQTDDTKKPLTLTAASDPLFKGDVNQWKQFANTLKLRLIIRAGNKVAFPNTTFDPIGFLADDAIVNPVYTKVSGKQNPQWDNFAYSEANAARTVGIQYVPTPYVLSYYDGSKLVDTGRGKMVYKSWGGTNGSTTPKNQLGYQEADASKGTSPNAWFNGSSATSYNQLGIFKGPDAGYPLMLASESYFLQAEANVRSLVGTPANAKANFNKGIEYSFRYLYKNAANTVSAGRNPTTAATDYIATNTTKYLANFDLATTQAQQVEAIITQKYIALNMISSAEAWNEWRRTGYPVNVAGSADPKLTFASKVSESTNPTKLPTRILYPDAEFRYNQNNVPKGISPYTSKIFWAL